MFLFKTTIVLQIGVSLPLYRTLSVNTRSVGESSSIKPFDLLDRLSTEKKTETRIAPRIREYTILLRRVLETLKFRPP